MGLVGTGVVGGWGLSSLKIKRYQTEFNRRLFQCLRASGLVRHVCVCVCQCVCVCVCVSVCVCVCVCQCVCVCVCVCVSCVC